MANNATFDELTVTGVLNIGRKGKMVIKSNNSIDMGVGNEAELLISDGKVDIATNVNNGLSNFFINNKRFEDYISTDEFIKNITLNGESVENKNGTVNLVIDTNYVSKDGDTINGELIIQNNSDDETRINGGTITAENIIIDKITLKHTFTAGDITISTIDNDIKINDLELNKNGITLKNAFILNNNGIQVNKITAINGDTIELGSKIKGTESLFDKIRVGITDEQFSNSTLTTQSLTVLEDTILNNVTAESIEVNTVGDSDNSVINKQYLESYVSDSLTDANIFNNCNIDIKILTNENGFTVYLHKNIPCDFTVTETGIIYSNLDITEDNAEDEITIDSNKISLSNTNRKARLTTEIEVEDKETTYGIRGYVQVSKDSKTSTIYTNAEVISWNKQKEYEKTLPFIWLEEND